MTFSPNRDSFLSAMSADCIPEGRSGPWYILKRLFPIPTSSVRADKEVTLPAGEYTFLYRWTEDTWANEPPGVVVMEDTPFELSTHLGFILQAHGKVLVTGLGLGCVVRGLLANQNVKHVTCIENSKDVLKLVAPHMPKRRLTIIEADARAWTAENRKPFDCAWHDLWTDRSKGEPHLDAWHTEILINCRGTVKRQGAWAFNRNLKESLIRWGFPWIG